MTDYQNKFFGSHKIVSSKETDKKTPKGQRLIEIIFENQDIWFVPENELKEFITNEIVDDTTFRERRSDKICIHLIEDLLETGIQIEWIEYILQKLRLSIQKSLDFANNKVWQKKVQNLTLLDIDSVLKDDTLQNPRNSIDSK